MEVAPTNSLFYSGFRHQVETRAGGQPDLHQLSRMHPCLSGFLLFPGFSGILLRRVGYL